MTPQGSLQAAAGTSGGCRFVRGGMQVLDSSAGEPKFCAAPGHTSSQSAPLKWTRSKKLRSGCRDALLCPTGRLHGACRLAVVHLVDAHLCTDASKYMSALLLSLSSMLHLEMPHVNVLSKMDMIQSYGPLAFNLDFYTEVREQNTMSTLADLIHVRRKMLFCDYWHVRRGYCPGGEDAVQVVRCRT